MIAPLQKINIIAQKRHQNQILEALQSIGIAHIIKPKKIKINKIIEQKIQKIDFDLTNIKFISGFLKDNIKEKQSLKDRLSMAKKPQTFNQIKKKKEKLNIDKLTKTIAGIETNLQEGQVKLDEIQKHLKELAPWINLTELPQETKHTQTITGCAPLNKYAEFIRILDYKIKELSIETLHQDSKGAYLQITFLKKHESQIKEILASHDFEIQIPPVKSNAAAEISHLKKEKDRVRLALKKWKKYIGKFKKYIETLKMAEDYLSWQKEKLQAKLSLRKTKFFVSIKAWVKKKDLKSLKNALCEVSSNILIINLKITNRDNPPVIIENKNFIAPFESVTGIYGLPRYNEIDPTPYLAPFFIVFFALCLTDAGYGLVMAITSFAAIKILQIPPKNQKLFRLLGYGGLLTFVVGALFGGWFGIDVAALSPGPIKNFIEFFKIIDPMKDILLFMMLCFGLGMAQVWFAQIVKVISGYKHKQTGAIASGIAWALFLAAAIVAIIGSGLKISALTNVRLYIILIPIGALMITESRNTKNLFLKPLVGIIAIVQGLISVMSDVLSYSRLMALGLATGIIAFIINTIAVIFRDLIPYAGWVIWFFILIGGHLFNLGINALGGFIHSGRLQFVEFFPKFMEGGGEKFEPLRRESKYFEISG
ncbi:MAG: V-type ATP synthase subunit I [Candidatus Jacksonbacteria bacterium]